MRCNTRVIKNRGAAQNGRIMIFCRESCLAVVRKVFLCERTAHERSPRSRMFSQLIFNTRHILGAIDAEVGLCRLNNADIKAVLQCPQLFE